jgi:hypothetical protein
LAERINILPKSIFWPFFIFLFIKFIIINTRILEAPRRLLRTVDRSPSSSPLSPSLASIRVFIFVLSHKQSSKNGDRGRNTEEAMDDSCAVCAESLEWVAYGPCGHREVCSTCVARLRFICEDTSCCICKTQSDVVFVTKVSTSALPSYFNLIIFRFSYSRCWFWFQFRVFNVFFQLLCASILI